MLKIRLSRAGKKGQPSFRVLVQEHTSAVKGKFIEELGYYRPTTPNKEFVVKMDRVQYWIGKGAQPSDSFAVLLKKQGVSGMEKFIALRNKQTKSKKAPKEVPATPAAPEAPAPEVAPAEAPVEAPVPEVAPAEAPVEAPAPEAAPEEAPVEAPATPEAPTEAPAAPEKTE